MCTSAGLYREGDPPQAAPWSGGGERDCPRAFVPAGGSATRAGAVAPTATPSHLPSQPSQRADRPLRVAGERLERLDRQSELLERRARPLQAEPTEPPDRRSPVALMLLVSQEQADAKRVFERDLGELGGGSANHGEVAGALRGLPVGRGRDEGCARRKKNLRAPPVLPRVLELLGSRSLGTAQVQLPETTSPGSEVTFAAPSTPQVT